MTMEPQATATFNIAGIGLISSWCGTGDFERNRIITHSPLAMRPKA